MKPVSLIDPGRKTPTDRAPSADPVSDDVQALTPAASAAAATRDMARLAMVTFIGTSPGSGLPISGIPLEEESAPSISVVLPGRKDPITGIPLSARCLCWRPEPRERGRWWQARRPTPNASPYAMSPTTNYVRA